MPLEMFSDLGAKRNFVLYGKSLNCKTAREQALSAHAINTESQCRVYIGVTGSGRSGRSNRSGTRARRKPQDSRGTLRLRILSVAFHGHAAPRHVSRYSST